MNSSEIRQKFLDFFKKKGHQIVPSSSLIPTDPSVLFTTAGMQQFKEYFLGKESPYGKRVASCQKCFRTSDIETVGDISHLTFVEMLGNFSFGDPEESRSFSEKGGAYGTGYFKKETIEWAYEFITKELDLEIDYVSIFAGDPSTGSGQVIPEDKESEKIWLNLGIPQSKIKKIGREDNFWGPTGLEGPCGPTTEIYLNNIEVWNLVFNEYYQDKDCKLTPLKQKGVDTGMGLERLMSVVQKKDSVFETDLFEPIIKEIEIKANKPYNSDLKSYRIITDHIKSAVFLISEGIFPGKNERESVLRRLIRDALGYGRLLNLPQNFVTQLAQKTVEIYENIYSEIKRKETDILTIIQNEEEKFGETLKKGIVDTSSEICKAGELTGDIAFESKASRGVPLEISKEIAIREGVKISDNLEIEFKKAAEKHKEISRAGVEKKFGGVGKDVGLIQAKFHTTTHLLHALLREILGKEVRQMGSDITIQRLRFDFSFSRKLTPEEIKKIENLVNRKIKEDLEVKKEEMQYEEAIKSGALAFFKEKYPEKVSVFSIGNFSKEICAGPHVKKTSELGRFKIIKEESSGAGIRRIRAILE
jgi:alanyl-tRNA synthetase